MILLPALWRRFVCSFIPWFFILESFGGHCTRLYVLTLDIVLEGMNISYAKAKGVCLVGVLGSFLGSTCAFLSSGRCGRTKLPFHEVFPAFFLNQRCSLDF